MTDISSLYHVEQCPVCRGAGVLGRPSGVPVGQEFTSSSAGPWQCGTCKGSGVLRVSNLTGNVESVEVRDASR